MSAREILFGDEVKKHLLEGVDALANAVAATLGPKGRNVMIQKSFGAPLVTKDGVTVAKEIELPGRFQNMGAQMVKEVASKTSDVAGDGTTTATVLAQVIFSQGSRLVAAGHGPMELKRGIDKATAAIVEELHRMKKDVTDNSEIAQVATISSNGDTYIGDKIAEAMDKVGKEGVITVEENSGIETVLNIVEGMQFDRGYLSPYFVTDTGRMECVLENPMILVCEKRISASQDILKIAGAVAQEGRPMVIIAEDVDGEALTTLVVNKMRNMLNSCAVKAPGFGARRKDQLGDLACLTGATFVTDELGIKLEGVEIGNLGSADRVIISKDTTTIVGGGGTDEEIQERIEQIKAQAESATSDYDREKLQERLAKLAGGIAVIRVGAATEIEMKEKKARVEDALHATKAAVAEGILPGGGVALIRAAHVLAALKETVGGEERFGVELIERACAEPLKRIAQNADDHLVSPDVILGKVREGTGAFGYNARTGEFGDMVEMGVIDPTKVTRSALQNAASVASLLLTTEVMIADLPTDPHPEMIPPGML